MRERVYYIKDLEILAGIKAHTIRIWEKRYNLLDPDRTDTNIRLYSDNDLRRLLNVACLVNHGYRISKVCTWDETTMANEILKLQKANPDVGTFLDRMTVHMVNFDGFAFTSLTEEIIRIYGFDEAVMKVFFPFFEKIGVFWQIGSIFPAQEHFISNLFRQKLIVEIDKIGTGNPDQDIMLFYLHENEMHELSLLYYSYRALKKGYRVYYIGQNVPIDDLKLLGRIEKIRYVFTVFINSIEKTDLEQYLVDIKEIFPDRKFFISGLQLKQHKPRIPSGFTVIGTYKDFESLV